MAFDSAGEKDGAKAPISLHPAFPAVVALWFAALLGLGSMILPVALVERAVAMTGLASIVPSASPPLGFMARGLIALAAGAAGAAMGLAIARHVARAHDSERPSRVAKFARGARRPISVNDELGGEGLVNGFGLPINRRRALAIAEDERPSDFLYMAPLPGNDDDHALPFEEQPAVSVADEPLELCDALDGVDADEANGEDGADAATEGSRIADLPDSAPPQEAAPRQEFRPAGPRADDAPLPFAAPSLARRALDDDGAHDAADEADAPPAAAAKTPDPDLAPVEQGQPFRGDWANAPLDELGLVQLVQRLGATLERRREWLASVPVTPPPPPATAAGIEPAPAEEAAQAMAAYFGAPSGAAEIAPVGEADCAADPAAPASPAPAAFEPRPSLLQSWPADDDDDADVMPSFTLPLRKSVSPTIAFDNPAAPAAAGSDEPTESYSSLLAMGNPFAAKAGGFVRIEEPEADSDAVAPAVVFPGHGTAAPATRAFDPPGRSAPSLAAAPPVPANADDALRAALATLQRMSGTA